MIKIKGDPEEVVETPAECRLEFEDEEDNINSMDNKYVKVGDHITGYVKEMHRHRQKGRYTHFSGPELIYFNGVVIYVEDSVVFNKGDATQRISARIWNDSGRQKQITFYKYTGADTVMTYNSRLSVHDEYIIYFK